MVRKGTRLLESVSVEISTIEELKTPQPNVSNKDAADIGQKIRYLADQLETLNTTLASVLAQLDITLSALRDALRGAESKDFSTLEARFTPLLKGSVFNDAVTADTDIFGSNLTPTNSPTTFRIYVCFDAAGVLTVRRTSGGTTVSEQLNSGTTLTANAAYIFDVPVESGESINLQYSVNATALKIMVLEVSGVLS